MNAPRPELDLRPLAQALTQLERSLGYAGSAQARDDAGLAEQFRNSVVQCFEFSYELCWKMLKRRLELDAASPDAVDAYSYREMIREAAARRLIADPLAWFRHRELRNLTAHTYDARRAQEVLAHAPALLRDGRELLAVLESRQA